jgi:soluble lytic murein transglycosylase-like protein
MALSAEQVAQLLYQVGFRGEDLVTMLAIGRRESRYDPNAHRTDNPNPNAFTGDVGLFQINSSNLGFLRQAIGISSMQELLDPVTNARAAYAIQQQSGWQPWAAAAGGWNANGSPTYGTNVQAAREAVNNAQAQGLLGANWTGGSSVPAPASMGASTPTSTFHLPSDAKVVNIAGTWDIYALFDVGGVTVSYKIPTNGAVDYSDKPPTHMSQADFAQLGAVDGGDATELGTVSVSFGSFRAYWDSILAQVMGFNNPAKDDPEVKRVLAEFAGRPDMSPAELQNRLEATTWWKSRAEGELQWNGLAEGEKAKRRGDIAAQMADTWAQFTGEYVNADDPRIQNYVEQLASGKMGFGAWTEQVVKKAAGDNPNSPYQRQIADEQKAQKQPGIDIENTAMRIRQTTGEWGIKWSEATIQDWARKIVNKDASDDDLLESLKDQALVAYAWKPRDISTRQAAAPWKETIDRVYETNADLFDPELQKALAAGQPVWEFEQALKSNNRWLSTKNAREQLTTLAGSTGRIMGFS